MWLYNLLFALSLPLLLARLWWRGRKLPAYRQRIGERFGGPSSAAPANPQPSQKTIWLHAVSVGESIAAAPVIEKLLTEFNYRVVVTTTTPTGSAQVLARFGDRVIHVYNPYDLPCFINRFLQRYQPSLLIVMETELWPNTLACCTQAGIPTLLANARLSAKSARGYQRFSHLSRQLMQNLSSVAAQNTVDGQRFIELGLAPQKLTVTGNIKFDMTLTDAVQEKAALFRQNLGQRPVLIAGSTHPGEDEIVLDAFSQIRRQYPDLLLILVPRHPDRFKDVAELCSSRQFSLVNRSQNQIPTAEDDILLGDTMGELSLLYGCADIAFIGNSLNGGGGHNLLEAALWSIPIVSGPGLFNFQQIATDLSARNALAIVDSSQTLADICLRLLKFENEAKIMGHEAYNYVEQNRGALHKLMVTIQLLAG